jgi:hypothetical protein
MNGSNSKKISLGIAFSLILLVTIACGAGPKPAPDTPTPEIPTPTTPPTPTSPPLYLSVTMTSVPRSEESQKPPYSVKAQIPNLQGSTDDRVTKFNNAMAELTQEEIARFKDNARMGYATPGSNGSFYEQKYTLLSAPGNVLSLKFDIYSYIEGSAHPGNQTRVVNYDLESGTDLNLDQLFKPGSDYLQTIANYCIAQLKTRPIDFQANSAGANPTLQNYSNWNITPDGLLITFDEYQVAAYAAGAQLVTIPYSELQSILATDGPLAQYIP